LGTCFSGKENLARARTRAPTFESSSPEIFRGSTQTREREDLAYPRDPRASVEV